MPGLNPFSGYFAGGENTGGTDDTGGLSINPGVYALGLNGITSSGGGGSGSTTTLSNGTGGSGGSGILIIRYLLPEI